MEGLNVKEFVACLACGIEIGDSRFQIIRTFDGEVDEVVGNLTWCRMCAEFATVRLFNGVRPGATYEVVKCERSG